MKSLLLIFILCLITNFGFAQITVIKEPETLKKSIAEPFPLVWDSTSRFFYDPLSQNIDFLKKYIGQELYYFSDSPIYKEVPNKDTAKYERVENDTMVTLNLMKIIDIKNTNNKFGNNIGSWYFELASQKDTIYYIPDNQDFRFYENYLIYYNEKGKTRKLSLVKKGYSGLNILKKPDKNKFVGKFIKIVAHRPIPFYQENYLSLYKRKKPCKFAITPYEFKKGKILKIVDVNIDTSTNSFVSNSSYTNSLLYGRSGKNYKRKIEDASQIELNKAFDNSSFFWDWYLKLIDNDSNYFYVVNSSKNFCLLGFIKKSKEIYLNKTFYVKYSTETFDTWDNLLAGPKSEIDKYFDEGAPWTCKDVVIIDKKGFDNKINKVKLLIENHYGYKLYAYFPQYLKRDKFSNKIVKETDSHNYYDIDIIDNFFTQDEYNIFQNKKREEINEQLRKNKLIKQNLINEYGNYYGNLIYKGEIVVGMTKEMCVAAKGEPIIKKYVETGYGRTDEWKYGIINNSVYFKNNKIIKINW